MGGKSRVSEVNRGGCCGFCASRTRAGSYTTLLQTGVGETKWKEEFNKNSNRIMAERVDDML
jgi:hypothetical protein